MNLMKTLASVVLTFSLCLLTGCSGSQTAQDQPDTDQGPTISIHELGEFQNTPPSNSSNRAQAEQKPSQ